MKNGYQRTEIREVESNGEKLMTKDNCDTFEKVYESPMRIYNVFNKFYFELMFTKYRYCNKTFRSPIKFHKTFILNTKHIGITLFDKYYSFGIHYGTYDPSISGM